MRSATLAACVVAGLTVTGCGGPGGPPPEIHSIVEQAVRDRGASGLEGYVTRDATCRPHPDGWADGVGYTFLCRVATEDGAPHELQCGYAESGGFSVVGCHDNAPRSKDQSHRTD